MNSRINQLVRSLLQKDSLEQCSLPELQQFADRHPYFGAAQLLLTKKMQTDHPDGYDAQLQKTLLFFHNPMWVEQLLGDAGNAELIKSKKEELVVETKTEEAPEVVAASPGPAISEPEKIISAEPPQQNEVEPIPETVTEPAIIPIVEPPTQEHEMDAESIPATEPVTSNEGLAAPAEEIPPAVESMPSERLVPEIKQDEPLLAIPALKIEPVSNTNDDLVFEPFHTVDYFASQGIKFKEEEKPKDKFGQQLKSFTEWLKTLKKVPVTEIAKASEPVSEKKVEEMAETSIVDREVLTEAMAEVWEKQGNRAKAIDIYSKLSLLEPSKSTYFAAKIEDLKKS